MIDCRLLVALALLISLPAQADVLREVTFQWDPVEGAQKYELQLTPNDVKNKALDGITTIVESAQWVGVISPGTYQMKIRSYDARNAPGDWSEPVEVKVELPQVELLHPKEESQIPTGSHKVALVKFQWKSVYGAKHYNLDIRGLSPNKNEFKQQITTRETMHSIELPVAHTYHWSITPAFDEKNMGKTTTTKKGFKLIGQQIDSPVIEKPATDYFDEVKWSSPEYSENFSYRLQKKHGNVWKTLVPHQKTKLNIIDFSKYNKGTYKLLVKAHSPLRKGSQTSQLVFKMKSHRMPAAVQNKILMDSIKKRSKFYGIASYYITQIKYQATSIEYGSESAFKTIGGTGRLGLGYNFEPSRWGLFGIIDASGFIQNGSNRTFTSSELHATWNTNISQRQTLLIGGGIYTKELPYFAEDSSGSNTQEVYQKVSQRGLHFGLEYWRPLNETIGFQILYRQYLGLKSGQAPQGTSLNDSLSSQIGFLGSYRISQSMIGFLGYNYKKDQMKFNVSNPSNNSQGNESQISHEGHYLNIKLEIDF